MHSTLPLLTLYCTNCCSFRIIVIIIIIRIIIFITGTDRLHCYSYNIHRNMKQQTLNS